MSATAPEKPLRRFPPPCWTQDEALALIQAYRERWYALRRGYLRTNDWDAVAELVGKLFPGASPAKTSAQCRHKIEKLRQRYRAEKQRALAFPGSGQFVSTWFYFEPMDAMEKNGSSPDEETQPGNDLRIVSSNCSDFVHVGLNPGRGIRFKPVGSDSSNLVTVAATSNNFRVSPNYADQKDEFEDGYSRKPKLNSQNYTLPLNHHDLEQSSFPPRKFSKNPNQNHGYWTENVEEDRDNGEDDVWVKMPKYGDGDRYCFDGENGLKRGTKRKQETVKDNDSDSMGQIVASIKLLADGFVKTEKMKMDMVREIEKMRMEAEIKRNEMLLESQKQLVEAFVKGLVDNKKQ